jgi:hypothetical protein
MRQMGRQTTLIQGAHDPSSGSRARTHRGHQQGPPSTESQKKKEEKEDKEEREGKGKEREKKGLDQTVSWGAEGNTEPEDTRQEGDTRA